MDAGGPGELGDADDGVLDVAWSDHHEVRELVYDDEEIRVGLEYALASGGEHTSPATTARLKSSMWRYPNDARSSYRMSISLTTHCSASAAFLGFVMMG